MRTKGDYGGDRAGSRSSSTVHLYMTGRRIDKARIEQDIDRGADAMVTVRSGRDRGAAPARFSSCL